MCRKIIRKINDFGATGVPKSIKMARDEEVEKGKRPRDEEFRKGERGTKNWGQGAGIIFRHIGATWPILDDFWDPAKSDRAPKAVQKNQYGYFLVSPGDRRPEKIGFERRSERK